MIPTLISSRVSGITWTGFQKLSQISVWIKKGIYFLKSKQKMWSLHVNYYRRIVDFNFMFSRVNVGVKYTLKRVYLFTRLFLYVVWELLYSGKV